MNPTLEQFGLDKLSPEDRLALAVQLWDSVVAESEPMLTDAQRVELEQRVADADTNPDDGVDWDTIRAEARARWQK
jgi:putative addiction module component (TIGR02574 family)